MRIVIRDMTASDTDGAARARVEGWRHAYRGLVPQEILDGLSARRASAVLRRGLPGEPAGNVHLVAEAEGAGVIGWAWFGPYRPDEELGETTGAGWGELHALHVLPPFIGHGVGRSLMAAVQRRLAAEGHHRLRLWVLSGNTPARRFYRQAGFAPDGVERTVELLGTSVEEVRYARTLDGVGMPAGRGERRRA